MHPKVPKVAKAWVDGVAEEDITLIRVVGGGSGWGEKEAVNGGEEVKRAVGCTTDSGGDERARTKGRAEHTMILGDREVAAEQLAGGLGGGDGRVG